MAERSFSQLPTTSSHIGRRIQNNRRGVFPVSEYWIHAIPVIVFFCFFTLWCFSRPGSLEMSDGDIMSVHRLEKSIAVRNETHVSLAVLASSAISPSSDFVSANQTLTTPHNTTKSHKASKSHNATKSLNATKSADKAKQPSRRLR